MISLPSALELEWKEWRGGWRDVTVIHFEEGRGIQITPQTDKPSYKSLKKKNKGI